MFSRGKRPVAIDARHPLGWVAPWLMLVSTASGAPPLPPTNPVGAPESPSASPSPATPTPTPNATGAKNELTIVPTADGGLQLRSASTGIAMLRLSTPALRRAAPQVQELRIDGHRVAEVRIPLRGRPSEEVWIADIGVRPPRVIWSGLTGPRDADEETAVFVEATEQRVFEYQTAAHVTRCDGEAVRLLPRAWDFVSGRFRPIVSTAPPRAAQKLTARRGDPAMPTGRPIGGFHFTSASTTAAAGEDARALAAPTALDDGDPKTVWSEGLGGDGRGEFLTARASAGHYRVRGFRIVPGDASTPASFKARNRIKSLALALGPEADRRFEVEFLEDPAAARNPATAYWIALPSPVASACVTATIRDVFRGTEAAPAGGGGTTAISDFEVFTELDGSAGADRLVADMAAGTDCASRVPLLVALGDSAVMPAAQAILGARGVGRECLVEALSRMAGAATSVVALDALAAALVGASPNEEKIISLALSKVAKPPVRAVAELLGANKASADDRARAARVLADFDDPDAGAALVAAAGSTENAEARLAIVQALGRSRAVTLAMLAAALEAARAAAAGGGPSARREGDLLRALPALGRRTEDDHAAAIELVRRSLAGGRSFEVRARAVLALGELRDPRIVADLSAVRDNSDDAVLRFLAARELGAVGGRTALAALRAALDDGDPRVRETAAQGLGAHADKESEALLIAAAKKEPWPFARRAEVEALSRTCGPPARELLVRAMERDVDEVRRAALVGLVRCKDARARPTLLSTLKGRRGSATLRELAAALLGDLGDRQVASELAGSLAELVNEAEADLAIEGVAVAALRSLGRLGGSDAAAAAARLAVDARHPYRHLAVEMLGEICDDGVGAKTLAQVEAGTDPTLAAAAQTSGRHCRRASASPRPPTRP